MWNNGHQTAAVAVVMLRVFYCYISLLVLNDFLEIICLRILWTKFAPNDANYAQIIYRVHE